MEDKLNNKIKNQHVLDNIAESIYDGLVAIDNDFNIIYVNNRFADIYEKSPSDFIGKKCTDVIGFDHCYKSCPHRNIINNQEDFSEHNLHCQKHESGPFCVSASPIIDQEGNTIGILELYRNMKQLGMYIGTLEETNAALMIEKERLHTILDDISDGYYTATPEGVITSVNEKLLKIVNKTAQDLIGYKCADVLCSDECDEDCPLVWAVKNKTNVINAHQRMLIGKEMTPYEKSIMVNKNAKGKVESVIGVVSKVSETVALRKSAENAFEYHNIITKSDNMKEILELVEESAPTDAPILIKGETGTGKELIAKAIQKLSHRKNQPFVKINCSALTESLLESELFGHVKGAFTGAVLNYAGKFKKADKGTIFLDEVENMSPALQSKLLRVIEEQEFEPVGSNRLEKVNVRIIAASNQSLLDLIEKGVFRSDLYYRLNVIKIIIPPLRERIGDLSVLIDFRLNYLRKKYNKDITAISTRGMNVLKQYHWPGNIRQLFGALEYAFLRAKSERIERKDLPEEIFVGNESFIKDSSTPETVSKKEIERLLKLYPKNRRRIAFELGVSRTTLWRKMQEYNIVH